MDLTDPVADVTLDAPVPASVGPAESPPAAPPARPMALRLQFWLGIAVSALTTWAFAHGMDWSELGRLLGSCDKGLVLTVVGLNVTQLLLRGWRWQALLQPYGLGFGPAMNGVMLATAANNVLPARAGEVLRVTWLSAEYRQPAAPLLVTVVVERVFDLVAVAALALWAALWAAQRQGGGSFTGTATVAAGTALVVSLGVVAALVIVAWSGRSGTSSWIRFVPRRWRATAERLLGQVSRAVLQDTHPLALVHAALRTVLLWGVAGISVGVCLLSLDIHVGPAGWFVVLTAILAGIAVPAAPGFVGVYHLAAKVALTWLGVADGPARAAAVLLHASSYIVATGWGAAVALGIALRGGLGMGSRREAGKEPQPCGGKRTPEMPKDATGGSENVTGEEFWRGMRLGLDAARDGSAWNSRTAQGLGWTGMVMGGLLLWLHPRPDPLADVVLAPLVMALLYFVAERWTNGRGALVALVLYLAGLMASVSVLTPAVNSLAARNLTCAGSAQLLVGLGGLLLLLSRAVSPFAWAALVVLASNFHPQFVFVPLLMMTLLDPRTLLLRWSLKEARGAALRSSVICLVASYLERAWAMTDGVTLSLAWWISSWLMVGEIFMPTIARGILACLLAVSTVAGFPAWPGMGVVLLLAYAISRTGRRETQKLDEPASLPSTPAAVSTTA